MSLLQKPQHASLLELRSLAKESRNLPGFALGEAPGAQSLESRGTISSSSVLGTGSCQFVSRSTARQPGAPGTTVCGDIKIGWCRATGSRTPSVSEGQVQTSREVSGSGQVGQADALASTLH